MDQERMQKKKRIAQDETAKEKKNNLDMTKIEPFLIDTSEQNISIL